MTFISKENNVVYKNRMQFSSFCLIEEALVNTLNKMLFHTTNAFEASNHDSCMHTYRLNFQESKSTHHTGKG